MPPIATCPFVGTNGTQIAGNTTDFFGGTGGLTWNYVGGGNVTDWQINADRAFNTSSGTAILLLPAGTADIDQEVIVRNPSGALIILIFRSDVTGTTYLQVWYEQGSPGRVRIFTEALVQIGTTWTSGNVVQNDLLRVTANGTALATYVGVVTAVTATSSTYQSQTYVGIRGGGGADLVNAYSLSAFAVATPTVEILSYAPTGNTYFATSGSGGTGTASFQWQRSATADSGFANLSDGSGISGATTDTLVDGSATALTGVELFYRCVISWSVSGGPDTSNTIGPVIGVHAADSLVIGDSVEAGNGGVDSPRVKWVVYVQTLYGPRNASYTNVSQGGASTTRWYNSLVNGATGTAQGGGSSTITLANAASSTDNFYNNCRITITSGTGAGQVRYVSSYVGSTRVATVNTAWGVTPDNTSVYLFSGVTLQLSIDLALGLAATPPKSTCEIRLGINDAASGRIASVYAANLLGIATEALVQGYTQIIIHYPTGVALTSVMEVMQTYLPAIDGLANDTTIRIGDTASFSWFSSHPELTQDGTHPTDDGNTYLAVNTALGTAKGLGDVPSTGTGVSGARIFGGF